jgi:hypothetical protein
VTTTPTTNVVSTQQFGLGALRSFVGTATTPDMNANATEPDRIDRDLLEPSPSAGWRDVYRVLNVNSDHVAAMTRIDRPPRYRRKHRQGVSS